MGDPLQDKIVLVTGRSTGIGLGIAKRFVSERANRIGFNMSDQLTLVFGRGGIINPFLIESVTLAGYPQISGRYRHGQFTRPSLISGGSHGSVVTHVCPEAGDLAATLLSAATASFALAQDRASAQQSRARGGPCQLSRSIRYS
jgi:hypothetical protein